MNSIAQTCVTFVGANYGAHNKKNIDKSIIYSTILALLLGISLGGVILIFANPLLNLYIDDLVSLEYGYSRLKIILLTYFLCGTMDVFALSLRALGCSLFPTIVSLLGVCGIRIFWTYTIFMIPEYHTLNSLILSYPISWVITSIIHLITLLIVRKKLYKSM